MTNRYDWLYMDVLPDGHRAFYTVDPREVALADNTGMYPQDTDDGVLWLNFSESHFSESLYMGSEQLIPLRNNDGEISKTFSNEATIMLLSATYDWPINVGGILFKAVKV
jgi:hypothetical protein